MNNKNIYSNIELVIESTSNYSKGNSANYKRLCNWNESIIGNVSTVGSNGDPSHYGLYDMGGQVYQWTDSPYNHDTYKILRGGCFASKTSHSISKNHFKSLYIDESLSDGFIGFRIASYTNPYNYTNYNLISNTNNKPDICDKRKIGAVDYTYYLNTYLVSNNEYCEYLNAIDPEGIHNKHLYDPRSKLSPAGGIIFEECNQLGQKYQLKNNMGNKPVTFIKWDMAIKYCNWLHNNKQSSWSNVLSGAYESNNNRSLSAKYFLPSENEWYKGAYYDPNKSGTASPGYWTYSTNSDDDPLAIICDDAGNAIGVEKEFADTKIFPIIIRATDDTVTESSESCPSVSITAYETPWFSGYKGDSLTTISATISKLNLNKVYTYQFSSLSSNWPCKISPISGQFIADEESYSINAVLQFKPQDVYNYKTFNSNLPYILDPVLKNSNFSNEIYNNLLLTITNQDCVPTSENIKITKTFMTDDNSVGLPIISQKDCASISFSTPSGSNAIEISGSLCSQYIPLIMIVDNPTVGKKYRYLLSSSEPQVTFFPRSGIVSFGGGSGSYNRIAALLDLNNQDSAVINVSLSREDVAYSVSDYVSVKCVKPCEKSANNHANFDNKALWGFCAPACSGNQPQQRIIASVTTVGTNGGPSSYGTYDQDGNVLELCESFGFAQEIYRGGAFNSTILGKYARFNFDTDPMPNPYSDFVGFRVASYTNPYNYSGFRLVSDIGSPPTGNIADPDTGYGSVKYTYNIGTYPVTNSEYCNFLNSTSTTGVNGVLGHPSSGWIYNPMMSGCYGGIDRTGVGTLADPYVYTVQSNMSSKPVRHVDKLMAFRYSNWLHNNKQNGWQYSASGSYIFLPNTNSISGVRTDCAKYFVTNENEWYKAAYYDGNNTNDTSAQYWTYATQSNTLPGAVLASNIGNGLIPTT